MRKDIIHEAVKRALQNENWLITADPFSFKSGGIWLHADLSAEKILYAQKENHEIVVEIKSFKDNSLTHDFHEAIGQYIDYKGALLDEQLNADLFLGISITTWKRLQKFPFYTRRISQNNIKLLIVDIEKEKIIKWIE